VAVAVSLAVAVAVAVAVPRRGTGGDSGTWLRVFLSVSARRVVDGEGPLMMPRRRVEVPGVRRLLNQSVNQSNHQGSQIFKSINQSNHQGSQNLNQLIHQDSQILKQSNHQSIRIRRFWLINQFSRIRRFSINQTINQSGFADFD
jgi:hypothetical protein